MTGKTRVWSFWRRAIVTAVMALSGCRLFDRVCTTDIQPGIVVTSVRDAVSGATLPDPRGAVRDGAYMDSLRVWHSGQLAAAFERPGMYDIEVVHEGYLPWTRANVRVRDASCHTEKVFLDANLTAVP